MMKLCTILCNTSTVQLHQSGPCAATDENSALHYSADMDSCEAMTEDLDVAKAPPVIRHIIRELLELAGVNL